MQLIAALPIEAGMTVSVVGGGGKTTMMFAAARELTRQGAATLITTTTAIYHPDHDHRAYQHLLIGAIDNETFARHAVSGGVVVAALARIAATAKLKGFAPQRIDALHAGGWFDYIFVEADGAKGRPVKAPADHEPVVPGCTAITVGVIGLDCLGKPLTDTNVHRPDQMTTVTGLAPKAPISMEAVMALVASPKGLFKGIRHRKIVLLNKADDGPLQETGAGLARKIMHHCPQVERVLVTRLQVPDPVHEVFQ